VNKGNPPMEIETGMVDKKVPTASKSKPWEQSGENRGYQD